MSARKYITLKWLLEKKACASGLKAFIAMYGRHGRPTIHSVIQDIYLRPEAIDYISWPVWILGISYGDDLVRRVVSDMYDIKKWDSLFEKYYHLDSEILREATGRGII